MSHFSEIKTNLKNSTTLKKALKAMGFEVVEAESGVDVRGYFGDSLKAEFKILTSTHYDIGFVKDETGNYQVVGDWELLPKVSNIEQELFTNHLKQEYAKTAIVETAQAQGYEVETVVDEETGNIEMVVTQW